MLKSVFVLAVLAITLGGCMSAQPAPVPPEESVVHTADEAIEIALRYMRQRDLVEGYDHDSAEASEEPASWYVFVPRVQQTLPPGSVIEVLKKDGLARLIPGR